ncbi:WD40 repeat, partial [Dillenia turbinata]
MQSQTDKPIGIRTLISRYIESCKIKGVSPNEDILSAFCQVEVRKSYFQDCCMEIFVHHLEDATICPILHVLAEIDASVIEAVDMIYQSSCGLNGENTLALLCVVNQKLRTVVLQDLPLGKDFFLDLSRRGLTCKILKLRSSHLRMLDLIGNFTQLHTLNLDVVRTVMIRGLVLHLAERQKRKLTLIGFSGRPSIDFGEHFGSEDIFSIGEVITNPKAQVPKEYFLYESEAEFPSDQPGSDFRHLLHDDFLRSNGCINERHEVSYGFLRAEDEEESLKTMQEFTYVAQNHFLHPSPLCFEKHYREYMIVSLPCLEVLDNLPIRKADREMASAIFSKYFEHLPYNRCCRESIASILQKREMGVSHAYPHTSKLKRRNPSGRSKNFFSRSLSAAKVGSSSAWPHSQRLSLSTSPLGGEGSSFRPRQFEYHPSNPCLMAFGTLDGELVVINHENEHIQQQGAYYDSVGSSSIQPRYLIAGSDDGALKLYDIKHLPSKITSIYNGASSTIFDNFDQLTSVHVNSTDELFLASGYSRNVALYDIASGRCIQIFTDMHQEHINVVKFANHSPSIFATSSFDQDIKLWDRRQKPIHPCYTASSCRGNVMACFSPDDHYLLVSAIDNEVKQLLGVDGRLVINFEIAPMGSSQNYTRSYYMNGRDYIISGSCDEHVVRICCAQTGRRLRDIAFEGKGPGSSMFVQSLRGDPFRYLQVLVFESYKFWVFEMSMLQDFNISVLAAYMRSSSKSEIVKMIIPRNSLTAHSPLHPLAGEHNI